MKLVVFENMARELAGYVRCGGLSKADVMDKLQNAAIAHGLVDEIGQERVQAALARSFEEPKPPPRTDLPALTVVTDSAKPAARLEFDCLADVIPEPIEWIWPGRLARRKLALWAGDPSIGKTQLAIASAACISKGDKWPDATSAQKGASLFLSAEDSASDTLRPRFEAAGADLRRIHILRATFTAEGRRRTFSLQTDLEMLGSKVKALGNVHLVIIDPITSYMGKIDSHRTTDVRAVLEPLADFADHYNVAVLGISHPPKASQAKALHAITGSLAFVAAARLVDIVVEEAGTDRRLLLPVKNNLGPNAAGLAFRLAQRIITNDIVASYVVWDSKPVTTTANQALNEAANHAKDGDHSLREAKDFLCEKLADGEVEAGEVEKEAENLGIKKRTLKRARKLLGVVSKKSAFRGKWVLSLPPQAGGPPS
jgi:hypothetical protein